MLLVAGIIFKRIASYHPRIIIFFSINFLLLVNTLMMLVLVPIKLSFREVKLLTQLVLLAQ